MLTPAEDRIHKYIEKIPGVDCWVWTGSTSKAGYGNIVDRGKIVQATHVMYRIENKTSVPLGMVLMHKCDFPTCVRPDHLIVGTKKQNTQDMLKKRRHRFGENSKTSKLNDKKVAEIRRSNEDALNIAARLGVSKSLIYSIRLRRHWKHVE